MITHNRLTRMAVVCGSTMGLGLAGCGSSPPTHYYTLAVVGPATTPQLASTDLVALGSITLPKILDQPQMVRRLGENGVDYDEYNRWAAALDDLVRHALAEDLGKRTGQTVLPTAVSAGKAPQLIYRIDIDRFDAYQDGTVTLAARWALSGPEYPPQNSLYDQITLQEPSGGATPEAIAATMSRALGALADRMSLLLRNVPDSIHPTGESESQPVGAHRP